MFVKREREKIMELHRIVSVEDVYWEALWHLYESAFPSAERRNRQQMERMLSERTDMYFNAVLEEELAGFFVYWVFGDFYYLEYLAVFPELRNKRIGQKVLEYAAQYLKGSRLLEVEPPADEITTRRVRFYQRNGYEVLDKDYSQPSYDGEKEGVALWIMGNRSYDNPEVLQRRLESIKQKVYRENY